MELIKSGWIINYMEINKNCKCDAVRLKTMNLPTHFISYYLLPIFTQNYKFGFKYFGNEIKLFILTFYLLIGQQDE